MINEEVFDGICFFHCPNEKCGYKGQVPYKENEEIRCPICSKVIEEKDIYNKTKKKINRQINDNSSVKTEESLFNY